MTTHTRPPLAVRLADLFRGHRRLPDPAGLYAMRVANVGFWDEQPARPGLAYDDKGMDPGSHDHPTRIEEPGDRHPEPRPPWMTAPQPALTGPGALGVFYAAADLRDQRAPLGVPQGLVRPYAPEPEPEPEPAWYPPLDLHDDLAECVIFRDTVHGHFVRQEHARGRRAQPGETWLQEHARVYGERFTGELDDIARRAAGAPLPDYRIAELWAAGPCTLTGTVA